MNPILFAKLFSAMEKFIEQNCESDEWQDFWSPENLALHMAQAASIVLTATIESSVFTKEQEN